MARTSYNPFIIANDDFEMIVQPGKYKKWDQKIQSDVVFSIKNKNNEYIQLTNNQIETVWELMDLFWFKVDKVQRLSDPEFIKILLKPEDQIAFLSDPDYQHSNRNKPAVVIEKKMDSSNSKDTVQQTMNDIFADIESWKVVGTPINQVVYNWDEERYLQFRAWLAASVKHVLKEDTPEKS